MVSSFMAALFDATLATTAATLLVWLLRRPLRRLAGAGLAYVAWALVPLAGLAALLPRMPSMANPIAPVAIPLRSVVDGAGAAVAASGAGAWMPTLWLAGAVALASLFAARQWRFARRLCDRDARGHDGGTPLGPAVVGLWRPRIVLPSDFERRYSPEEQALVLEHERQHLRRGDLWAQALCTVLRCLFWFNPALHLAASRFRLDQELACDADVLTRHPRARRCYGEVMLKTQLADFGLPLGCHWQSYHPLKERIAMLTRPLPSARRRRAAAATLSLCLAILTLTAWAAEPAQPVEPAVGPTADVASLSPPAYPTDAAEARVGGDVVLEILVGEDGRAEEVLVKSSRPEGVFDQAAMDAARTWRFNPGTDADGKPVKGRILVPVKFEPPSGEAGEE